FSSAAKVLPSTRLMSANFPMAQVPGRCCARGGTGGSGERKCSQGNAGEAIGNSLEEICAQKGGGMCRRRDLEQRTSVCPRETGESRQIAEHSGWRLRSSGVNGSPASKDNRCCGGVTTKAAVQGTIAGLMEPPENKVTAPGRLKVFLGYASGV